MHADWLYHTSTSVICLTLFVLMCACAYVGYLLKLKLKLKTGEMGVVETSLYGLFALLLAFTFNMSSDRYDARRKELTEEANSIVSCALCIKLFPDSTKATMQQLLHQYLQSRISLYEAGGKQPTMQHAIDISDSTSNKMFELAATYSGLPEYQTKTKLTLENISQMKSMATNRERAFAERVPDTIMLLLFFMILICSFYLGFLVQLDSLRSWVTIIGFLLFSITVIFVIMDLDRPQGGLITVGSYETMLESLETGIDK